MIRFGRLSTAAFTLVALTWGLLVFGASVRVNGAGLACPDWPLCFGEVIPTIDFGVFFEFGHRVYAGLVSLVFVGIGIAMMVKRLPARLLALWAMGFVVLGVQVVLGGLTVLELLAEWTVTSHLLAGNTFCLSVLLLGLALRAHENGLDLAPVSMVHRVGSVAVAVLLPLQLALGGLVSSSYAGLVCPSWPTCAGGVWFPSLEGLIGLQIAHRMVGYGLALLVLAVFVGTANHRSLRAPSATLVLLVVAQIGLGVANVLLRLPVEVTLAHTGIAALIVLTTTWLNWRAFAAPVAGPVVTPSGSLVEAA